MRRYERLHHAVHLELTGRGLGQTARRCCCSRCDARSIASSRACAEVRTTKLAHEGRGGHIRNDHSFTTTALPSCCRDLSLSGQNDFTIPYSSGTGMRRTILSIVAVALCAMETRGGIRIHLADGKTGMPVPNEHVLVFYGDSAADIRAQTHHQETYTDSAGAARLSGVKGLLEIWIDHHPLCQPTVRTFSVDAIQRSGIVAANTCGTVTHAAVPAELYLFVRKETFIESMRH